eukprot:CAMPEP_0181183550 /NCGR_PEP_ID=MMETSP1096-20121128/8486_1 /TAXON_ID=156174 ORGANISM="Chrysochromulina ericina, Strain CCMP281" /NCGR_SAMPLE_ID=MMETSP1096 /ASSEMBLY_ACC=CAM_ASM_000453 /LENGTH=156 /DNA_ID=CAMNT_0023272239 /DNA_START=359 /DNA_END=827 /DNA_ORIENTATION=+
MACFAAFLRPRRLPTCVGAQPAQPLHGRAEASAVAGRRVPKLGSGLGQTHAGNASNSYSRSSSTASSFCFFAFALGPSPLATRAFFSIGKGFALYFARRKAASREVMMPVLEFASGPGICVWSFAFGVRVEPQLDMKAFVGAVRRKNALEAVLTVA